MTNRTLAPMTHGFATVDGPSRFGCLPFLATIEFRLA